MTASEDLGDEIQIIFLKCTKMNFYAIFFVKITKKNLLINKIS